jgi:conjugal transfer ATP-binding protein TraC
MSFLDKIFPSKKKKEEEKIFKEEVIEVKDIIAPASIKVEQNFLRLGDLYSKTYFIFSYPRYLSTGWMTPVININIPEDISFFIFPIDPSLIAKQLRRKITEVSAEILERQEKGLIRDPELEAAYHDIEELRTKLHTAQSRVFRFSAYINVYAQSEEELREIELTLRSIFEARLIYLKPATFRQERGFNSCLPYGLDLLDNSVPMDTEVLSTFFPFVSFDLSSNEGILYGINRHNNSLVMFDRFTLENANFVVFAKSGAGKSYAIKLEILRYLMQGVDIIVIDPENEYRLLSDAIGGTFIDISLASSNHINPFDLPPVREDEKPEDVLRSNVINLVGLIRTMLNGLTPEEDAICDVALTETYAAKDISAQTDPSTWKDNIPIMSDFETVLRGMKGAESLVRKIEKFTKGTFANFFNQPSNISLDNNFVVFGIRDMEESLRPIAFYMIMRYVWNTIRAELKKRILVIDEAWWLMTSEDSASFLYGICKRARKYWLGVTTITQDVSDFLKSDYGKPIINNASLLLLMRQSPATVDLLKSVFNLTETEKTLLLSCRVGEGIFVAGDKRVLIQVVASYAEDQFITSSPEEIVKIKRAKEMMK